MQQSEDFFSNLLEYNFYKTGIVKEHSDMLANYIKKDTPLSNNYLYVVESELKVSNNYSILQINIKNPKWPPNDNTVMQYSYPLKDVTYETLSKAAEKNTQLILLNILNESEIKKIGIANLGDSEYWVESKKMKKKREKKKRKGSLLYINNIYNGESKNVESVILPFGSNTVDDGGYINKIFVSPFWINSVYFSVTDGLLMEKN